MAEAETAPAAVRPRRRVLAQTAQIALEGVALAFLIAGAASFVAYRSREELAASLAQDWLARHGVEGEIVVNRIDATGFSGRLRLGPAKDPDLIADRIDVDYGLTAPWTGGQFGVSTRSIRLIHPRAKVSFDGKRLNFGTLDPLIRELLARPKTNAPAPDIRIDDGELRLATPYGLVRADHGQASLSEGKVRRLDARFLAGKYHAGGGAAELAGGELHASGDGESIDGTLTLDLPTVGQGDVGASEARLALGLSNLRYVLNGKVVTVTAQGQVRGGAAAFHAGALRTVAPRIDVALPTFEASSGAALAGRFDATGNLSAASLAGPVSARGIAGKVQMRGANWSTASGAMRLRTPITMQATAQSAPFSLGQRSLMLTSAKGDFNGRLDTGLAEALTGTANFTGSGAFSRVDAGRIAANLPIFGQEPPYTAALTRALERFTISAPGLDLAVGGKGARIRPRRPVELVSASGAKALVTPKDLRFDTSVQGGLTLALSGGGLPPVDIDATSFSWRNGELDAQGALTTALDFGFAKDAKVSATGRARYGRGGFSFTASRCATLTADHLDFGENDIEHPSGLACPVPETPLVTANDGGWRLTGRLQEGKAVVPFLMARTEDAAGRFVIDGRTGQTITADVDLTDAPVIDTTDPVRFNPMRAKGAAHLVADVWRGEFDLATPPGHALGRVSLVHDQASGAGHADIDASHIVFAKEGLQPIDITPNAVLLADAAGPASFVGRIDWTKDQEATGTGRIGTTGLAFTSPLGPVTGLRTDIALTSLAPIVTAKGQTASAALIDAFAPLTDAVATFDFSDEVLHIQSARVGVARGHLMLEPLDFPLEEKGRTLTGAINLDDVDLGQLIAVTSFADKIKAELVVDGRLPFVADAEHFRFLKGQIATVRPGRLSINREILSGVETGAATVEPPKELAGVVPEEPAINAVQDLAFQAMENLHVDSLRATVESLPSGRLATLFSIQGSHDPPVGEKVELTLGELISRKFFTRRIPLPKGTPIDLTLDTTLNFDEVLQGMKSSFETFQKLKIQSRSAQVQRKESK